MIHTFNRIIYLSGPMTGIEDYNYPLFDYVSERLRGLGHRVYNPTEHPLAQELKDYMESGVNEKVKLLIKTIFASYCTFICLEADTIIMLPEWDTSRGAMLEQNLATVVSLDKFYWSDISDEC